MELMIVIAIIAILTAIAIPVFSAQKAKAHDAAVLQSTRDAGTAALSAALNAPETLSMADLAGWRPTDDAEVSIAAYDPATGAVCLQGFSADSKRYKEETPALYDTDAGTFVDGSSGICSTGAGAGDGGSSGEEDLTAPQEELPMPETNADGVPYIYHIEHCDLTFMPGTITQGGISSMFWSLHTEYGDPIDGYAVDGNRRGAFNDVFYLADKSQETGNRCTWKAYDSDDPMNGFQEDAQVLIIDNNGIPFVDSRWAGTGTLNRPLMPLPTTGEFYVPRFMVSYPGKMHGVKELIDDRGDHIDVYRTYWNQPSPIIVAPPTNNYQYTLFLNTPTGTWDNLLNCGWADQSC